MSPETQTRAWLIALAVLLIFLWLVHPVLLPFIAGLVIAYFLAPVVSFFERNNIPRWLGAILVLLSFGSIAAAIITLVLPLISSQVGALVDAAPGYIQKLRTSYTPWVEEWLQRFQPDDVEKLRSAAGQSAGQAANWLAKLFREVVSGGVALIDAFALAIIAPVVAFFTLRDWPTLTTSIDSVFPRKHYDVIRAQLTDIDNTLSGFIRGQALVCLALGCIYSTGLTMVGLKYSLAIGVTSGVLSFIPYIGTAFGWISSIILALVQFDDMMHVGLVVVVFYVGHFLEAYVLTPKLVGNRVGLHPIWILFALICGAKLMGFTGLLIAVPTAAVLGVLVRFAIRSYKDSPMYKD